MVTLIITLVTRSHDPSSTVHEVMQIVGVGDSGLVTSFTEMCASIMAHTKVQSVQSLLKETYGAYRALERNPTPKALHHLNFMFLGLVFRLQGTLNPQLQSLD